MSAGDNERWLSRSRAAVWHPCTQMKLHESLPLVPIARGQGAWLIDFEGRRYLDAVSSWWVNLFGHGHPRIGAAIGAQLDEIEHVMLAGFTHAPVVELSERLARIAPRGLGHAFYGSDGASAVEIALKMAFHYWRNRGVTTKSTFVSLAGSYHGETLGALGVTDVALFRDTYAPLLLQHAKVPAPDASAGNTGPQAWAAADVAGDALDAHLEAHRDSIAAMIVEPLVQGASGMVMHHPRYLARVRESCTRHDVLLIADEIMTGFGRTGTLFAWEQADAAAPDLMCLSKGITGGYLPLSAVLATDAIYDAFYDDDVTRGFLHSHSYTGNALACRAALAVLDLFEHENVIVENRERAQRWRALAQPIAEHANVERFRTCGMITAFEVRTKRRDFPRWCFAQALERELLLRPIGSTVYFMPPYVTTDEEFEHLVRGSLEIVDQA